MTAQDVCRSHGGLAPQARSAAYVRQTEADSRRQFDHEYRRWLREWQTWQARRIAITSVRLEMPVEQVTPFAIGICRSLYGEPQGPETEPKLRHDRRFGPRRRGEHLP
jgi:hypothetical protein